MNEKLTAAQPPFFSVLHATSVVAAARDHRESDGLLINIPLQRMLVTVHMTTGVIVRWVIESPTKFDEISERQAQLEKAGLKYVCLTMHTDRLVPIAPKATH